MISNSAHITISAILLSYHLVSVAGAPQLELHDWKGPTGLFGTVIGEDDGNVSFAVTSETGYSSVVNSNGGLHPAYNAITSADVGYFIDEQCANLIVNLGIVPGTVFADSRGNELPNYVFYVPFGAKHIHLEAGEIIYYLDWVDNMCVPIALLENQERDFYQVLPNSFEATGFRNDLAPPMRLVPELPSPVECVFESSFECPAR